jgi:hypothetical protein
LGDSTEENLMRVSLLFVSVAAVAALSACNSSEAPTPAASATPTPTPLPTTVPAAFQGRWGATPDDCKAGSEGLLTVDADKLELPESTATLSKVVEATEARFRGTFDFKGKGEARTTDEVFDLQGDMLVRREVGEGATMKPFTYTRCA